MTSDAEQEEQVPARIGFDEHRDVIFEGILPKQLRPGRGCQSAA